MKRSLRRCFGVAAIIPAAFAILLAGPLLSAPVGAQATGEGATQDFRQMLPETDMHSMPVAKTLPPRSAAAATPFSSAGVAKNPQAPDAVAVGSSTCVACHSQENLQFSHTLHARAFRAGAMGSNADRSCESCHGAGSVHAAKPTQAGSIIAFTHNSATPIGTQTETCLSCHVGGARQHWTGSVHEARGLSCSDCHNPMAKLSPEGLMSKHSINETCATCHQDIRAKFNRRSHMPLPEGQMSCADCHNPHGTVTKPLLKTDTLNGTCYTCHAEKRGPMLFEHAPVRQNCMNCHDPHGSNQQTLLVAPMPMLCQQCHTMTRHPNDLQTPIGLGTGAANDERLMGRSCIACHTNVHGSNHPTGTRLHR